MNLRPGLLVGVLLVLLPTPLTAHEGHRHEEGFQLAAPAFPPGGAIPAKYARAGENVSPHLKVTGVPKGAKSLALVLHDPDAPNGNWTHWIVYNLPPDTTGFSSQKLPSGADQGTNSWGRAAYDGPAPPSGSGRHRYVFTLYALDQKLSADQPMTAAELAARIKEHLLATATLTGTFQAK
ncbi:MAG: YbhB/YbcL family Raf kinase inhibitor-like protein [Verrucomicrobiota bacterium]